MPNASTLAAIAVTKENMIKKTSILRLMVGSILMLAFSMGQSRTLFIDFNNAESEIRIFQGKVTDKARPVVVIPSYERITKNQRAAARRANSSIERNTALAQECATSGRPRVDRCDEVYAAIRRAELSRIAATGDYSFNDLKAELLAFFAQEPREKFEILVISGHHETGYYNGELTQAKERDLASMLIDSGMNRSQFNTVVLLACGTGTRDAYIDYLAPLFPEVVLIFGAEESAPTRDEARNLAFIRKLLLARPGLLQAKTRQEVEPVYRRLLAEHWPVSLLWRANTLFFAHGIEPFEVRRGQPAGQ